MQPQVRKYNDVDLDNHMQLTSGKCKALLYVCIASQNIYNWDRHTDK